VKLRAAHLEALVQASREIFVDRMVEYVRDDRRGDHDRLGEQPLRELIWRALDAAEAINVVSEAGICRYIELWLDHGELCDRDGAERLVLVNDDGLDEIDKLDAIEALVHG
jgi:hypothetical protein